MTTLQDALKDFSESIGDFIVVMLDSLSNSIDNLAKRVEKNVALGLWLIVGVVGFGLLMGVSI